MSVTELVTNLEREDAFDFLDNGQYSTRMKFPSRINDFVISINHVYSLHKLYICSISRGSKGKNCSFCEEILKIGMKLP